MKKLVITETTKRTSFKIAGAPVVVNQEYDLALSSTIEILNTFGFPAEPMDFFKYKIVDTDISSVNEATVRVSFEVDKTTLPLQYNLTELLSINESLVFSDLIPGSNNFDRIQINSIVGKGFWLLNGIPLEENQVLFYYQILNELIFVASDSGSKPDYNLLKFQFGHKLGFWPYENSIKIDTVSLAELNVLNNVVDPILEENIESLDYDVNVLNGPESASFELEIDTTGFLNIGSPVENKIIITNNDVETIYNTSGIFIFAGILTEAGGLALQVEIQKLYPYASDSSISIELKKINGFVDGIDATKNKIVLNIPKSIIT